MRAKVIPATVLVLLATMLVLLRGTAAQPSNLKFQATLVWGTTNSVPPAGKDYKPVSPEILKKLQELPLKWTYWFEVSRKDFDAPQDIVKEVPVSAKCQLNVKNLGNSELELLLLGKGKEVFRGKQILPKSEMLVLGGNAPDSTSWLVILKRLE